MDTEQTNYLITPEKIAALLGRTLSEVEINNFTLYLNIAKLRVEDLLCTKLESELEDDLQLLIARCFGVVSSENSKEFDVKSKKIEDYSVEYDLEANAMAVFANENEKIIAKYSNCQGEIRSGDPRYERIFPL